MTKVITQATPPNLIGQPSVEFRKNDFDAAIWNKGYDVLIEKAVKCPCSTKDNEAWSSCNNCLGMGWIFIDPVQTKALMFNINKDTKYKNWSLELLGTIGLTVRSAEKPSYMDRITVIDSGSISNYSYFSEILEIRDLEGDPYVFCSYEPSSIEYLYAFEDYNKVLIKLTSDDYSVSTDNSYVINLSYDFSSISNFNGVISVRYKHKLQYHVLDIPHDIRASYKTNSDGKEEQVQLPLNAIARKAHNVFEMKEKDGSGFLTN